MRDTKGKAVLAASIFLVLALGLAVWVTPAQAITGGQADESNEYSNVGAVLFRSGGKLYFLCSGTLINTQVFLTAGHCTSYLEYLDDMGLIEDVYVSFDPQPTSGSNLLSVSQVITHPDYKYNYQRSNTNDVGLLILESPVAGITPADLAPEGFLDQLRAQRKLRGAKFTVVGYGGTLDWPPPEITYPLRRFFTEESAFQALLKEWLVLSQNLALGNGGSCYGDSGGPVFWKETDGSLILVAIVGWGDDPCVATGFNYRVDISATRQFIYTYV